MANNKLKCPVFQPSQQSWIKLLLRHFGTKENFDLENHLPQQVFPPLPLINVALLPKFSSMKPQSFQTTLSEGRGEERNLVSVSTYGN